MLIFEIFDPRNTTFKFYDFTVHVLQTNNPNTNTIVCVCI